MSRAENKIIRTAAARVLKSVAPLLTDDAWNAYREYDYMETERVAARKALDELKDALDDRELRIHPPQD